MRTHGKHWPPINLPSSLPLHQSCWRAAQEASCCSYNIINLLAKLTEQMASSLNFLSFSLLHSILNFQTERTIQCTERMAPWTADAVPARHGQTMSARNEHWSFGVAIIRRLKCVHWIREANQFVSAGCIISLFLVTDMKRSMSLQKTGGARSLELLSL